MLIDCIPFVRREPRPRSITKNPPETFEQAASSEDLPMRHFPKGLQAQATILGRCGSLEWQGARMWQSGPKAGVDCPEKSRVPHHALQRC